MAAAFDPEALIQELAGAKEVKARQSVIRRVRRRAAIKEDSAQLVNAGICPVLVKALSEWEDRDCKFWCALAVVEFIARDEYAEPDPERQKLFDDAGIMECMMPYLSYIHIDKSSPAAQVLYTLTLENSELAQKLRDMPNVIDMLEKIKDQDTFKHAEKLLCVLSALSQST